VRFEIPIPIQIAWYKAERAFTRPLRHLTFGRIWKRNILVAKITGSYGKTTTSRMLAAILKASGHTVGLWSSDGVLVDGKQMPGTGRSCYYGARRVFRHKAITAAVLECTAGGQVMQGQYAPRCNTAALLNVSNMHTGQYGLQTVEDIARVKQSIVETSTGAVVVNLDDPYSTAVAANRPAALVTGFSMNPGNHALQDLLQQGGNSITLSDDEDYLVLLSATGKPEKLARIAAIAETANGTARHVAANAMAAAGLALSLGASKHAIRSGLEQEPFAAHLKPRFSVLEAPGFKLVLDKALGPAALVQGVQAQARIDAAGKRVAVLSAPPATTDDMITQMAAAVADQFDALICRGNAASRYAMALASTAHGASDVLEEPDLDAACKKAKSLAGANGLVYVQVAYPHHHDEIRQALGISPTCKQPQGR
jgi:cyanophycin synthetase